MRLRVYQWGELAGVVFLLASTAIQVFYLEPLKRDIEWRLAAFTMQQNGQIQTKAVYATRLATLKALKAPDADIREAEAERDALLAKYKSSDADISDYLIEKERVEDLLQVVVLGLFATGAVLAGIGRAMEMLTARRVG
jgi:hypothetical protein